MVRLMTVALILTLAVTLFGCKQAPQPTNPEPPPAVETAPPVAEPPAAEATKPAATEEKSVGPKLDGEEGKEVKTTKTGLKYIVLEEGEGEKPKSGQTIVAEYTGWLTDGTKFDSSKDRPNEEFSFPVGTGQVIPGWDEALLDMKVGERRKLIVPADLAYGDQSMGPIPANSTLVFEVKLVKIK